MNAMIRENIIRIREALPQGVELVAVSKFRPLEELVEAYGCGQRLFAESRPLEFEKKALALPDDVQWHFIGHLQTNKLRNVLPYVYMIHSVDSIHLLEAIENWCAGVRSAQRSAKVKVLLEVHIGAEETKQGFPPAAALALPWDEMDSAYPHVEICGLMGMASHVNDIALIDNDFALIKGLFDDITAAHPGLKHFTQLSIGMSGDWTVAVRHGATMVRIGSAIFCPQ